VKAAKKRWAEGLEAGEESGGAANAGGVAFAATLSPGSKSNFNIK
jgi:hypothetical protein